MAQEDSQVAPGTLEVVRTFLNTWRIPNDTREPIDEFVSLSGHAAVLLHLVRGFRQRGSEVSIMPELVRQLRDDLRSTLGASDVLVLSEWLSRQPVEVQLSPDAEGMPDPPVQTSRRREM